MIFRDTLIARRNEIESELGLLSVNILKGGYKTSQIVWEFAHQKKKTWMDFAAYLVVVGFTAKPVDDDIKKFFALSKEKAEIDHCLNLFPPPPPASATKRKRPHRRRKPRNQ